MITATDVACVCVVIKTWRYVASGNTGFISENVKTCNYFELPDCRLVANPYRIQTKMKFVSGSNSST